MAEEQKIQAKTKLGVEDTPTSPPALIVLNFIGLASTELSFCCYTNYDVLAHKSAIQEELVINKQDLAEDNLFHLNEAFQLITGGEKI